MRNQNSGTGFATLFLVFFCCLFLIGCNEKKSDGLDVNGKPVSISEFHGKWVVINYWATWCGHCTQEMTELQTLSKLYPENICVLGVSYDNLSPKEIKAFQQKTGVTYPMLQNLSLQNYGVDAVTTLPVTFIICPQGILRATLHGPQTSEKIATITSQIGTS